MTKEVTIEIERKQTTTHTIQNMEMACVSTDGKFREAHYYCTPISSFAINYSKDWITELFEQERIRAIEYIKDEKYPNSDTRIMKSFDDIREVLTSHEKNYFQIDITNQISSGEITVLNSNDNEMFGAHKILVSWKPDDWLVRTNKNMLSVYTNQEFWDLYTKKY